MRRHERATQTPSSPPHAEIKRLKRQSHFDKLIELGRLKLRGTIAWWIWGIAHIYFLIAAQGSASRSHGCGSTPATSPPRG
jgi:NADH dehydrogenase FAD-containing subunit